MRKESDADGHAHLCDINRVLDVLGSKVLCHVGGGIGDEMRWEERVVGGIDAALGAAGRVCFYKGLGGHQV
jgi:hypothetical protein